jgi:hypothetical protein
MTLLARKRRTTVTSVVEWAVMKALASDVDGLVEMHGDKAVNVLDQVWDPDTADRFVKLALGFPALLRFEEDQLWKAIRENKMFWVGENRPNFKAIRDHWSSLEAKYLGEKV